MIKYKDSETDEILTLEDLQKEYQELKSEGKKEAETFNDYLQNCLEGTLEEI